MGERNNLEFEFKYITFKELKELNDDNLILRKDSSKERLLACPDIRDDFPQFFYIINDKNQIACSVKAFPDVLWIGGKKYPWAWMGDILTEESYRGKGLGTILTREYRRVLHEKGIGCGAVFGSDISFYICRKVGFSLPGHAERYLMLKTFRPYFEVHVKSKSMIRILDQFSKPMIKLLFQFHYGKKRLNGLEVETLKYSINDKEQMNNNLPEVSYQTKFHFNDDIKKLIWKINASNEKVRSHCSLYVIKEIKSGEPIAYFVVRIKWQTKPIIEKYKNFKLMTLMDYGLFRNDFKIYSTLGKEVMKLFWESDAEVLEIYSTVALFNLIIKRLGMIKVGKGMSFAFSFPENWNLGKEGEAIRDWHLTHFCGDAFAF